MNAGVTADGSHAPAVTPATGAAPATEVSTTEVSVTDVPAGEALVGFKSHLRPTLVPGDAAYLVSLRGVTALGGSEAEVLVPLLDGTRTVGAVERQASLELGRESAAAAQRPLEVAALHGLRPPGTPPPHPPRGGAGGAEAEAYWDLAGLDGGATAAGLARSGVAVEALGGLDPAPVVEACRASGLTVVAPPGDPAGHHGLTVVAPPDGPAGHHGLTVVAPPDDPTGHHGLTVVAPPDDPTGHHALTAVAPPGDPAGRPAGPVALLLVLCDDYLSPELAEVDARHRRTGVPWLPVRFCGTDPWIGPFFRPGSGPCWHCLAVRLRGHRHSELPVRQALGLAGPVPRPPAGLAAGRALAANLAALEAAKWLAGLRHPEQNRLLTLDTLRLRTDAHPVSRLPQCASCGDPGLVARRVNAPFVPAPRPKAEGGDRALTAARMLGVHGRLVGPVTGVVKELRRSPDGPDFLTSYVSGPNLAMESASFAGLRSGLRALSGGKGRTDEEARVSALCEAVERYSGTRHGDEPTVRDSLRGLGDIAVHPGDVQLYGARQYAERERWNASHSPFHHVPPPFDEERATEWTPVWSLTEGRQRLLPTSMLYYARGGTGNAPAADGLWADSNGNAAGSSPEDAVVQGFLELVERDAVALWWYNRTRQPAVDLAAFGDEWTERLCAGLARAGREVWALDLTSDLGVPVVAALSRRTDRPTEDVIFGFGAHFDPRVALRRALSEMGQLLPAVGHTRSGGTGYGITDPEPLDWWRRATVAGQPYLLPDPAAAPLTPGRVAAERRPDLLDDVRAITALVKDRGLDLLVLDQTRPDLELPVVKVIVPGLRHFWARFAPGRLFDVPVILGRLAEPTPYERLNPIPLFV
ncbi:TOMM precursor leader peptide-binding protein [Streptomyces sp. NPDC058527]|uniref:TOMM precursor leader peptide-binding protein n=1 Tax=Streptomyces sp. NPDC058527 TaxID=3346539 RepID=UPI00365CFC32